MTNKQPQPPSPADETSRDDGPPQDSEAQAWAAAAMQRCNELEGLLRQVVVWFDSPLEAANDDNDGEPEIIGAAVNLNRLIDRAIELLDGPAQPASEGDASAHDEPTPALFVPRSLPSSSQSFN